MANVLALHLYACASKPFTHPSLFLVRRILIPCCPHVFTTVAFWLSPYDALHRAALHCAPQGMIFVVAFSSSLDVAAIEIGENGVLALRRSGGAVLVAGVRGFA